MLEQKIEELQQAIETFNAEQQTKKRGLEKKPALGWVAKLVAPIFFSAMTSLAEQIENKTAKGFTLLAIETLSEIVAIMADNEQPNKVNALIAWSSTVSNEKLLHLIDLLIDLVINSKGVGYRKQSVIDLLQRIKTFI